MTLMNLELFEFKLDPKTLKLERCQSFEKAERFRTHRLLLGYSFKLKPNKSCDGTKDRVQRFVADLWKTDMFGVAEFADAD